MSYTTCACANSLHFCTAIRPWLERDALPYSLITGVVATITSTENGWCSVLFNGDTPVVALAQIPTWPVMVASPYEPTPVYLREVMQEIYRNTSKPEGISATQLWATELSISAHKTFSEPVELRLYKLHTLTHLEKTIDGSCRFMTAHDIPLLRSWLNAIAHEEKSNEHTDTPQHGVTDTLSTEVLATWAPDFLLWENNALPCSMARVTKVGFGVVRIGDVYTPPHLRRSGYALHVVHALCMHLQQKGVTALSLFANPHTEGPTSLYHQIGFRPVHDHLCVNWQ